MQGGYSCREIRMIIAKIRFHTRWVESQRFLLLSLVFFFKLICSRKLGPAIAHMTGGRQLALWDGSLLMIERSNVNQIIMMMFLARRKKINLWRRCSLDRRHFDAPSNWQWTFSTRLYFTILQAKFCLFRSWYVVIFFVVLFFFWTQFHFLLKKSLREDPFIAVTDGTLCNCKK